MKLWQQSLINKTHTGQYFGDRIETRLWIQLIRLSQPVIKFSQGSIFVQVSNWCLFPAA